MFPLKVTKDMFPLLPDEIFEMFVKPQNDAGVNDFDSQPEGRWFYHFGGLSIEEFANLKWHREQIVYSGAAFHPESCGDILSLFNHVTGQAVSPWHPVDSVDRCKWHTQFVVNTGRLCAPIVGIRANGSIRVLDGTHRLVAIILSGKGDAIPIDAWVANVA